MFYKTKIIVFVYNNYIDGLSYDEIILKARICKISKELDFEIIDETITLINNII